MLQRFVDDPHKILVFFAKDAPSYVGTDAGAQRFLQKSVGYIPDVFTSPHFKAVQFLG